MKRTIILAVLVATVVAGHTIANIIAGTSFENELPNTGKYTLTTSATQDMLNDTTSTVDSTISSTNAGDLGFDAYYYDTLGDQGFTDGDYFGVADYYPGTPYPDGIQGYQMTDPDGKVVLTFDTVDVSAYSVVRVRADVFVGTNWEENDIISLIVETDDVNVVMIDMEGDDIDYSGLTGKWNTLWANIPTAATEATLVASLQSNSTDETLFFDTIQFIEGNLTDPNVSLSWEMAEGFFLADEKRGILDEYPEQSVAQGISQTEAYTGTQSLKIGHEDVSGTPQGYVAWINDLQVGDVVTAEFWAKSETSDSNGIRIWGHYTKNDDMDDYEGSAGGNNTYSGATWTKLRWSWLITDANATGLVVEARIYDDYPDVGYIDDITVWAPAHATITLPSATGYYCETNPEHDYNSDCKVDFRDFAEFALGWMNCNRYPSTACQE